MKHKPKKSRAPTRAEEQRRLVAQSRIIASDLAALSSEQDAEWTTQPSEPNSGREARWDMLVLNQQLGSELLREASRRSETARKRGQKKRLDDSVLPVVDVCRDFESEIASGASPTAAAGLIAPRYGVSASTILRRLGLKK